MCISGVYLITRITIYFSYKILYQLKSISFSFHLLTLITGSCKLFELFSKEDTSVFLNLIEEQAQISINNQRSIKILIKKTETRMMLRSCRIRFTVIKQIPTCKRRSHQHQSNNYADSSESFDISDLKLNKTKVPKNQTNVGPSV